MRNVIACSRIAEIDGPRGTRRAESADGTRHAHHRPAAAARRRPRGHRGGVRGRPGRRDPALDHDPLPVSAGTRPRLHARDGPGRLGPGLDVHLRDLPRRRGAGRHAQPHDARAGHRGDRLLGHQGAPRPWLRHGGRAHRLPLDLHRPGRRPRRVACRGRQPRLARGGRARRLHPGGHPALRDRQQGGEAGLLGRLPAPLGPRPAVHRPVPAEPGEMTGVRRALSVRASIVRRHDDPAAPDHDAHRGRRPPHGPAGPGTARRARPARRGPGGAAPSRRGPARHHLRPGALP
ncbi:hypothetical protein SGPA1_30016 [Streptomyces misionensis JCM 4497]